MTWVDPKLLTLGSIFLLVLLFWNLLNFHANHLGNAHSTSYSFLTFLLGFDSNIVLGFLFLSVSFYDLVLRHFYVSWDVLLADHECWELVFHNVFIFFVISVVKFQIVIIGINASLVHLIATNTTSSLSCISSVSNTLTSYGSWLFDYAWS